MINMIRKEHNAFQAFYDLLVEQDKQSKNPIGLEDEKIPINEYIEMKYLLDKIAVNMGDM